jgi:hypothetical protein
MMNRRGFLGLILAAGVAPAVVKASSIMRINPPKLIVPRGEIGMLDRFTVYEIQMTNVPELALSIDDFTARVMEPINSALTQAYYWALRDNMWLAANPPVVADANVRLREWVAHDGAFVAQVEDLLRMAFFESPSPKRLGEEAYSWVRDRLGESA